MYYGKDGKWDGQKLDQGAKPDTVKRQLTDCPCLVVFAICVAILVHIMGYAFAKGDPRRYLGLPSAQGGICGQSSGFEQQPYLYFCQDSEFDLSLANTVCVRSCSQQDIWQSARGCRGGVTADYVSRPVAGMICLPVPDALRKTQLTNRITGYLLLFPVLDWLLEVAELARAWQPIAISAVCALLLGGLYTYLLRKFTQVFIKACCLVMVLVPAILGVYIVYKSQTGGADGLPSTGDSTYDLVAGLALLGLALLFLVAVVCKRGSIQMVVTSIKAASEAIRSMPSLLAEPFVQLGGKIAITWFLLHGFFYLLSVPDTVDVQRDSYWHRLHISYRGYALVFIGFYIFMMLWILELWNSLSSFAISYSTQLWYFGTYEPVLKAKKMPLFVVFRGYLVGLQYHLGTLALGSAIIAVVQSVQLVLNGIYEASKDSGNFVGACLARLCMCCNACFERFLRFLTKNAYMDVAVNSQSFCKAAYHATWVLMDNAAAVFSLHGATYVLLVFGAGSISAAGAAITHMLCTFCPVWSDPASRQYVEDPVFLGLASAVVCFVIGLPFMVIFNDVADTILFCFALEKKRHPTAFAVKEEAKTCIRSARQCMFSVAPRSCDDMYSTKASAAKVSNVQKAMAHPPEVEALLGRKK